MRCCSALYCWSVYIYRRRIIKNSLCSFLVRLHALTRSRGEPVTEDLPEPSSILSVSSFRIIAPVASDRGFEGWISLLICSYSIFDLKGPGSTVSSPIPPRSTFFCLFALVRFMARGVVGSFADHLHLARDANFRRWDSSLLIIQR